MKRIFQIILATHLMLASLWANPTSLFWTNCTTDVLATGTGSLEGDYYFHVFDSPYQNLPLNTGFNIGLFTVQGWSGEAGLEGLWHTDDPIFFNAKIGTKEGHFFNHSPSFSIGFFGLGTHCGVTNSNVLNVVFGKELPEAIGGTFYVAYFGGSHCLGHDKRGFMVGYEHKFNKVTHDDGQEYYKWLVDIDWCSGKNSIGGGGVAFAYNFTPYILFETGPVFFNTTQYNGKWKWAAQVFITIPLWNKEKDI